MLRRATREAVEIRMMLDDQLWTAVADPAQLESAVLNLALNAQDAMPDGGCLSVATANMPLDSRYHDLNPEVPSGPYVMIAVTDDGHGMPKDVQRSRARCEAATNRKPGFPGTIVFRSATVIRRTDSLQARLNPRPTSHQSSIRVEPAMIKDLVVNLAIGAERDYAADYAVSIAETFAAHIAGIAFAYEPALPPTIMGGIPANFIDAQRAEAEKAASEAVSRYEEKARRAGLSAESRVMGASLAGAADLFGRVARRFDLSVVGQAEPDKVAPEELIIEAALFESGRPVVVVPYIQRDGLKLDRVMIGWDGSKNATRAIADALPFLARARAVDIVIVAAEGVKSDELPGADIALHLARHGLKVELKRIVTGGIDVANTVLSYAADSSIDFIVMGGYGHSRLREFILGGATRGILTSMTVPVLMSH